MVDHELITEEKFSYPEDKYLPVNQFDMMKKYSRDEGFREFVEKLQKDIQYMSSDSHRANRGKKDLNSEEIRDRLSKVSFELLNRSRSETEYSSIMKEIEDLEYAYKNVMERFLHRIGNFLRSIKILRKHLENTAKQFHTISRYTAHVTLVSSVMEVALVAGRVLRKVLDFNWSPKLSLLSTAIGSLSIAASFSALSYMKHSTSEITKSVRRESRFFTDLIILHRKGNWIDEEVLNLFPYGINLNFFGEKELNNKSVFEDKVSWRRYLCSAIILTNIQRDVKLLKDEIFLTTVKIFVESQAAEIWWHRIKIRKLLDDIRKKMDDISMKEITADHEELYNRTSLYLYPLLIPLLVNSWNSGGMRFFCNTVAAMLAIHDLADNESEECEELNKIVHIFQNDFNEITDICETLDNDYD